MWYVNLKPNEEEEFYSPREMMSSEIEDNFGKK
jgi:hypothetical protein